MADNKRRNPKFKKEKPEFDQQIVDLARVTRVMAGGKRMRFRACIVIGDRKGRVGTGLAKGKDVALAVGKAVKKAEKNLIRVNMDGNTIPHEVYIKDGAAKILLKPAPEGSGIISGGAVRTVLELAGIKNAVSKILGTNNKVSNVSATIKALQSLNKVKETKKEVYPVKVSEANESKANLTGAKKETVEKVDIKPEEKKEVESKK
jgi:small subunit ribosomal protein S5